MGKHSDIGFIGVKELREEITSGDASVKENIRDIIRKEITSGDATATSLFRDEIEKELRKELTSGDDTVSENIRDIVRKEITSGDATATSLFRDEIEKELRKELTSGDDTVSENIRDIVRKEVTSGDSTKKKDMREITREEITNPVSSFFKQTDGGTTADWNNQSISAAATTDPIDTINFGLKNIYFYSDKAGTLTIEVQKPDNTWLDYDTISASANTVESYIMSAQAIAIRLNFAPSATPASVTAWIVMRYI